MKVLIEGVLTKLFGIEEKDTDLPKGETVIAKNGAFKIGASSIFTIIKPAKTIWNSFKEIKPRATMDKKIPWNIFWGGAAWLRKQWKQHKNIEYVLILMYNDVLNQFMWACPEQKGTSASVDFSLADDKDIMKLIDEGWAVAGSIHNHFGYKGSAFQSGTDKHDEQKSGAAGVHFTMGYMDAPNLYDSEFHIRIVDGDFDKVIKLNECVHEPPEFNHPKEWAEKVKAKIIASAKIRNYTSTKKYVPKIYEYHKQNSTFDGYENSYTKYQKNKKKEKEKRINTIPNLSKINKSKWRTVSPNKTNDNNENDTFAYDVLCDIAVVDMVPEHSPEYEIVAEKYPTIAELHNGEHLLQAITMVKIILDGTKYALAENGDDAETKSLDLERTIKEISEACLTTIDHMKEFLDGQEELGQEETAVGMSASEQHDNDVTEEDVQYEFGLMNGEPVSLSELVNMANQSPE